jgi:hypothetical protein
MRHEVLAAALGIFLVGCGPALAQSGGASTPAKPGSVRVTTKAPDTDKWDAQSTPDGSKRVFKCKPLACPDAQAVTFTFSKSPTSTIDPQALEKFATIDLPKNMRAASAARAVLAENEEKLETLASKTTALKGYPAVFNETKISRGKSQTYYHTDIIFAGPVMIRVESASPNRDLAAKALTDFVEVMQIIEGPAPARPGLPGPPATRNL